jgi:hypothetical protein
MTTRQYREYQRQAEVIERHKIQLIHDQIDQLQDEINYCFKADMPHRIPGLQDSIENLKSQISNG